MQLFRVDRRTYREAVEVFYSNICFDFYDNDFGATLAFLQNLPRDGLLRLRHIEFTITEAQCEGWCDGTVASGHSARMLESQIARPYWGGGPPPKHDYKASWRAIVAFLASHTDLSHPSIAVNMGDGAWPFVEDTLMWPEQPDLSMFRCIYDLYIDVATALCSLKGLGDATFDLSVFEQLKPWLEKEVLGYQREPTFETPHQERMWQALWQRPRRYQTIPLWYNMDQRLEVSNYEPKP